MGDVHDDVADAGLVSSGGFTELVIAELFDWPPAA